MAVRVTAHLMWSRSLEEDWDSKFRSLVGRFSIGLALERSPIQAVVNLRHPMEPLTHPSTPAHRSAVYMFVPGMAEAKGITPAAVFWASLAAFTARSFRW